jgi:RES domain-containing protein
MSVTAWRIVKAKRGASAFSGYGARQSGGRWNSPGVPMVYTAGSASLAMLEMLVHIQSRDLLKHYVLFELSFDEKLVETIEVSKLPKAWRKSPPGIGSRRIGDEWVEKGRSVVLRVPSAVVPTEWNYLFNPVHPGFENVVIGPKTRVQFDPRLIKPA